MGKLNIAHHKSYHPYRRDNIERVRQDEEEARLKEEKEEGRMMLADSEARIELLRERALPSLSKKKNKHNDTAELDAILAGKPRALPSETTGQGSGPVLPTTNGHINFFEDFEQTTIRAALLSASAKHRAAASTSKETEKGVPLAPEKKDLNPWYSSRSVEDAERAREEEDEREKEKREEKRKRDTLRKSMHDPLTSITKQLAARPSSSSMPPPPRRLPQSSSSSSSSTGTSLSSERISRESTERQRALALIQRRQRTLAGSETPSTVRGGVDEEEGYGDVYNRREVEAAHRGRERWGRKERGWGDRGGDRDRDRGWGEEKDRNRDWGRERDRRRA